MSTFLLKLAGLAWSPEQLRSLLGPAALGIDGLELDVLHAVEGRETYAYLTIPGALAATAAGAMRRVFDTDLPAHCSAAQVIELSCTQDVAGQAAGRPASWHYIVETDIQPGAEQDFNDWYSTEHLPGLAAVPGTVRARRYLARPAAPRYYAAYDLETLETFGSEPWLAVRATDWSSRVRPSFMNTKRTMFKRVPPQKEA
ncbi:DUF4286 family protein [Pollutimonas sp. M17]|uniref:DUF4286 family protein n=1 Tax=Pollutimonas sp. M17 TaxID=2962065 RepID=UPI0021F43B40|nr:DUF4286 family protein [Pollutimonas sp. M17]UYO94122.1 hypothetical protein OEG81_01975 [Pollutimonas sp. M17]